MFLTVVGALNEGFAQTLGLFAVTLLGALPLGLIVSFGSMSRFSPLRWLTRTVIWVIRGTPLMLQLYIIFFIPGMVLPSGNPWPAGTAGRFMAASVAFIINYACYFAEIYRGGIQGVPVGQQEAGMVLGMTKSQIFFQVTLLQMVKEVIWAGKAFLKSSHGYKGLLWPLFFTGVYYLVFNGGLTLFFGWLEKKLDYFR